MNKRILILTFLVLGFASLQNGVAQSSELGAFDFLPQTVYANPALRPQGRLNIGIPGLSRISIGHGNNWFAPNKFLISDGNGAATLDANKILENIEKFAYTDVSVGVELLHVGMRFGNSYVHIRASERIEAGIKLPKDIFNLAAYGNVGTYPFENNTADFSDLNIDAIHYREYAVGYNYQLLEKWSFGLALKYLYGMERIKTTESSLRLTTNPIDYSLATRGGFVVNTSGIAGTFDEEGDDVHADIKNYLIGLKNHGFGADIGAAYRPNEKWQFGFSANDLGFIKWKSDIANYGTENAEFAFHGIDLTEFIFIEGSDFNDAFQNQIDSLLDDLENTYNFKKNKEAFTTALNGYLRYAVSYQLYETDKLSGKGWVNMVHGIGSSTVPFGFSVGYNQKVGNIIQAGVHYSKKRYFKGSFGAGLSLNAGFFQLYCLVENFRFAELTRITVSDKDNPSTSTELVYFSNPQNIRIQVGLNLTFGMKNDEPRHGRPMKR